MCALSCWLASPATGQWWSEKEKTGQVCPARKTTVEEGERMLPRLFIVIRGSDPGRMAWNILIGRKYEFGTKTVKIFLRQTIIWNSFSYTFILICLPPHSLYTRRCIDISTLNIGAYNYDLLVTIHICAHTYTSNHRIMHLDTQVLAYLRVHSPSPVIFLIYFHKLHKKAMNSCNLIIHLSHKIKIWVFV